MIERKGETDMAELKNEELEQVAGGWTPDPIIETHELYYPTDEQISELLRMG